MFSILAPGSASRRTTGRTRACCATTWGWWFPTRRSSGCGIRVGDETVGWTEGRSLVFDDTYEHEAWNDTDETRVVLFVDVVRPLRQPMRTANAAMIKAHRLVAVHPGRQAPPPGVGGIGSPAGDGRPSGVTDTNLSGGLPSRRCAFDRLLLALRGSVLTLGVVTATPAVAAEKTQAIPFTAATVTQTAAGYDVEWAAPSSAGAVKVYAGTDPTDVGTDEQVGSGKSTGLDRGHRARRRAPLVLRAGTRPRVARW